MTPRQENVIERLKVAVDNRLLLPAVLDLLIPNGKPYDTETQLFDYKLNLPTLNANPDADEKNAHKLAIAELIKDAVSFHNAFGGYIVFGVADKGRDRICGVQGDFNCADFNKSLQRYSGSSIECLYNAVSYPKEGGKSEILGILLIPRRASGAPPVKMQRRGPEKSPGKHCFAEEIYVRVRDECRPATNTHEDWHFLHSDRLPPEQHHEPAKKQIHSFLPARDEELLKFIGRAEHLSNLRQWVADPRSPTRLITGIGGLGKTTLAYRFAEEVIEVAAGGVDAVLWLTAKQQTYSALRGKMVSTMRVDFFDTRSLFEKILNFLNYEIPPEDEDPTDADLIDRVVEALSVYPAMIVVDDLDSLPPAEQKEVASALNGIALRTVGRELPASRILMTSRLDQGLPLTSIIKISGLERGEFAAYFRNICEVFGIGDFTSGEVGKIFRASSGSPLFAASIARLIKLGEGRSEVIEKWQGVDGEDVRSFAFQRELARLTGPQSRVLYATMLLGETSLEDIAEVLDLSSKAVRDQISELQAYHLISTNVHSGGETKISVPDELKAVLGLVRDNLGVAAKQIEEATARANAKGGANEKSIGLSIRSIARAWGEGRTDEALVEARALKAKFPNNADVASMLGAACLRVKPARFKEADQEVSLALNLGCSRPELTANIIAAKTGTEDWSGIRDYTKSKVSNEFNRDIALSAYIHASEKLIGVAAARGDNSRAAEVYIEIVERISAKIRGMRLDPSFFNELSEKMVESARRYIDNVERVNFRPGDRVVVFEAVYRLSTADILLTDIVTRGINSLSAWWGDVEGRPIVDIAACEILQKMLRKLEGMEARMVAIQPGTYILKKLQESRRDLEFRGATLQASLR